MISWRTILGLGPQRDPEYIEPTVPEAVLALCPVVRDEVLAAQTEGRNKGWNGDSKRRIATARLMRLYPEIPQRDLVLAIELVVRTLEK